MGEKVKNQDLDMNRISILTNSYKYFLENVMIIDYRDHFRLLVIHEHEVLMDRSYQSFKGAKIAFAKLFDERKWKHNDLPEWSRFYNPMAENLFASNYSPRPYYPVETAVGL